MENQQIGKAIQLRGLSGRVYVFIVYDLNHDFSNRKPHAGLFIITKKFLKDELSHHRLLNYDTIPDLSKFILNSNQINKLKSLNANKLCLLTRTKISGIDKVKKDIAFILENLEVV